nr:serine-threonine/tyrosine-protein kinase catalytic domain-containing protein [Tanacetum cinerariifolium]
MKLDPPRAGFRGERGGRRPRASIFDVMNRFYVTKRFFDDVSDRNSFLLLKNVMETSFLVLKNVFSFVYNFPVPDIYIGGWSDFLSKKNTLKEEREGIKKLRTGPGSSLELLQPCRQFTFSEIQLATKNFDESLIIGRGGFGKVYKGKIIHGAGGLTVAIKRLESTSNQGAVEFQAEVEMLTKLRHCHLVSLIGYCKDGQEMILVYEYMPRAARGLDYLHTGTGIEHGVIHRDVKSSNILLHKSWAAKISDFGLSKIGPTKHMEVVCHYVRDKVKSGFINPSYVSSKGQVVDVFTKVLLADQHQQLLNELSVSELLQPCRQFTFSEIQLATKNFDESLVIGRGDFGKVYKGKIIHGAGGLTVAIKRLESTSNQGAVEFQAEVEMLTKLRHCHLVSLIGYCKDGQEMILVYEYMPRGTLEDHLHKRLNSLPWVTRLKICIGAARGLDYLHTGTGIEHGVIHRDVKSSNILLHKVGQLKFLTLAYPK